MPVRVGVDVGGTFTKAVACDSGSAELVAESVIPTTHGSSRGVAEGVGRVVRDVAERVADLRRGPLLVVSHSTTQAVNALLEGDTARVGVLAIGARPHLRRARRRTRVGQIRLAPGHRLETLHELVDASAGLDRGAVEAAIERLVAAGAESVCVSEAFGVDEGQGERLALEVAAGLGVPACAGHELTGLYGLEMRTVTAALNAGILPAALAAADVVEAAVGDAAPGAPLLVMRGDGGCADLTAMRRHPLLTAFSGPAASVAGALRYLSVADGIVVEVGGTSTNVSVVKNGRPVLAYVRVHHHVTNVRSIDSRVAGVAGGSLVRLGRRFGRTGVVGVGPRSAHIAGLEYSCFAEPERLAGAELLTIAPRPGDSADYAVLEHADGERWALTPTCAANALAEVPPGAYSQGNADAARAGFTVAACALGADWEILARAVLKLAAGEVAALIEEAVAEHRLERPTVVGVGGGAGALVPTAASHIGLEWRLAPRGEVISSIGDALSLVRVEVERAVPRGSAEAVAQIHREAEEAAVAAGAAPETVRTESEAIPDRQAVRVVAQGAVALESGALPRGTQEPPADLDAAAAELLGEHARKVTDNRFYAVFAAPNGGTSERFAVLDRRGSVAARGDGLVVSGAPGEVADALREHMAALTRQIGPFAVAPGVRVLRGARLIDLTVLSAPDDVLQAALTECEMADGEPVVAIVSRS